MLWNLTEHFLYTRSYAEHFQIINLLGLTVAQSLSSQFWSSGNRVESRQIICTEPCHWDANNLHSARLRFRPRKIWLQSSSSSPSTSCCSENREPHCRVHPQLLRSQAILNKINVSSHILAPWFYDLHTEHIPHLLLSTTKILLLCFILCKQL